MSFKVLDEELEDRIRSKIRSSGKTVLQVERYPEFYSANWPTGMRASEFLSLLEKLMVPSSSQAIMYTRSKPENGEYKLSDVKTTKNLDEECLFLRVNSDQYNVSWHVAETGNPGEIKVLGFLSKRKNLETLRRVYKDTTGLDVPKDILENTLSDY
jgi:hypothetical protein